VTSGSAALRGSPGAAAPLSPKPERVWPAMGAAEFEVPGRSRHAARTGTFMSTPATKAMRQGHKPKCLVIVDDSAEWGPRGSIMPAAGRSAMMAGVVMLRIIETEDQNQQMGSASPTSCAPEAHEDAKRRARPCRGDAPTASPRITPEARHS